MLELLKPPLLVTIVRILGFEDSMAYLARTGLTTGSSILVTTNRGILHSNN